MLAAFRNYLLITEKLLTTDSSLLLKQLENELSEQLIRLLADSTQPVTAHKQRKRDLALQSAVDYIHASENTIVAIPDLCKVCNASQRTLEYAFRERYGLTPKEYTLVHRLNNVRKHLRAADPETNQISAIAQLHGFWHMGHVQFKLPKTVCRASL